MRPFLIGIPMENLKPLIVKAGKLSAASYEMLPETAMRKLGVRNCNRIYNEEFDTQVIVCEDDEYIFVVFEGTDSVTDVKTDLRFKTRKAFGSYRLHTGFFEAYAEIAAPVAEDALTRKMSADYNDKAKRTVYVGHSLGGALATLAAHTHNADFLITFGQPHVGGRKFRDSYKTRNTRYIRVVNHRDPVPLLLLWHPLYRQAGDELYVGRDYKYTWNPSLWFSFKERLVTLLDADDHNITDYVGRLELAL